MDGVITMDTLELEMENTAKLLPQGWSFIIEVENEWAGVTVERPDGSTIDMDTGDLDLTEQIVAIRQLVQDEQQKP